MDTELTRGLFAFECRAVNALQAAAVRRIDEEYEQLDTASATRTRTRGVQDPGGTPRDFFPIKSRFGFHPGGQSPNRRFLLGASAGPCLPPGPKRRCFGWSPTLEDVDIA